MEQTCERAVEIGLPSVAFTEHADFTPWAVPSGSHAPIDWVPIPPPLDVSGYLECLDRCRSRFPTVRIHSGVELGEPHWHESDTRALIARGNFERVLASVHSAPAYEASGYTEVGARYADQPAHQVVRDYLAEVARMIDRFDGFEILAHIDYPVRYWPRGVAPCDPWDFEDDYRNVLSSLAAAGKVLEVNTRVPLHLQVLLWWHDEGGQAITFASDAHSPNALANGFRDAIQMADAARFRPARDPYDFWRRK
jgi:histidinol-phosphatase (PHP family)